MSTIAVKKIKLGDNADTSKNFLIEVPAVADGTLTIKREGGINVLSVAADGGIELNATWKSYTPVLLGATTAGVGTYTIRQGEYLDLGTVVFVRIRLDWSAHTGTGAMHITLPTMADNTTLNALTTWGNGTNVGAAHVPLALVINSDAIQIYGVSTSGGGAAVPSMDTTGALVITGWYRKA